MSTTFSVLALFLAFAAIWFAAATQFRIERLSQDSLKAHVKSVQEAGRASDAALADLRRRLDTLEKELRSFSTHRRDDAELLAQLARRTQELRAAVTTTPRPAQPAEQRPQAPATGVNAA